MKYERLNILDYLLLSRKERNAVREYYNLINYDRLTKKFNASNKQDSPIETKTNNMKKYKVITDNLDWRNIRRGRIILVDKNLRSYSVVSDYGIVTWITDAEFQALLQTHPDWFQEVTNPTKEYTKEDMKNCFDQARLVHGLVGFKHDTFDDYLLSRKS